MSIRRVNISTVKKNDYKNIIGFLSNFEGETRDKKFWKTRMLIWWDKNPAFSENTKRGWVLKDLDKDLIVGFIANIPTFFVLKGEKIIVNNGSTYRVNKEYRMHSISLYLKWVNHSNKTIHFSTTPTPTVINILKLMKFDKFPNSVNFINFIPVNLYKLFKYKYDHNKILISIMRLLKDVPYYFYLILFKSIFNTNYKVKRIRRIDKNFDELWFKTKKKYLNTNFRDSNYVKWYCNEIGENGKVVFGCFKDNTLRAYAIFQITNGNFINSIHCLDIWGDKINASTLKLIMLKVLIFSKKNDIDIIDFPYINPEIDSYCRKIGFFKREYSLKRYFKLKGESIKDTNFNDRTYLTFAQGDKGL